MHFNSLLKNVDDRLKSVTLAIPDNWSQGRTVFGGVLTAMIVKAIIYRFKKQSDRRLDAI